MEYILPFLLCSFLLLVVPQYRHIVVYNGLYCSQSLPGGYSSECVESKKQPEKVVESLCIRSYKFTARGILSYPLLASMYICIYIYIYIYISENAVAFSI